MKHKIIKSLLSVLTAILCVFVFVACASKSDDDGKNVDAGSSLNGIYYLYANGQLDTSDFFQINGSTWSDKIGTKGTIEMDGTSIYMKYQSMAIPGVVESTSITYYGGTIGNGVFKCELWMSIPLIGNSVKYYCKTGKTPSDLPSGDNADDDVTDPSDTKRTVTFDANGGYTSISKMTFEIGAAMQNMPTPKRSGYDFDGWKDSSGNEYTSASIMPGNNLTLIAQWTRENKQYSDGYVSFTPATEGTKNIMTKFDYAGLVDKFVYVELTSDDIGGPSRVGMQGNFTLKTVEGMAYSINSGYSWIWYEGNFNTPNGAQRFTLRYGSNFQLVTILDGTGVVLQTYLVDIYVKHDYYINLYKDTDAITPFDSVRVIEGDYFSSVNHTQKVCDFTFDKHIYKVPINDSYLLDFDYSEPVTKNWDLYQTFKSQTITPELNGGTLDDDISVKPYEKEQTLPIPEKEGYDFIGWKLGELYFTDKDGNSGVNYLNANNGDEKLTASFEAKRLYWYDEGDELHAVFADPVITYTDGTKTEIVQITYSYDGTTLNNSNSFVVGESATVNAQKTIGHDFVGWYDDEQLLSTNMNYTFIVPNKEFVYTIKWQIDELLSNFEFIATVDKLTIVGVVNKNVSEIIVPFYTTAIKESAFRNCSSLTTVYWNAVECTSAGSLSYPIFSGCSKLTTVEIGNQVKTIPSYAFSGCSGLSEITVQNGNEIYHSAGNCIIETKSRTLIVGCKNSIIPSDGSVTSIGNDAFRSCSSLTSVEIPNSVTSIGDDAFRSCSSLTSIEIPDSVTSIGDYAFYLCSSLTSVTIGNGVTNIRYGAFRECSSLTSVTIPNNVTSIGSLAFEGCSSLTSVEIPNSVTSIGDRAFYNCSSLTSVTIGNSVSSIGNSAFYGCSQVIQIEGGIQYVDKWVVDCDRTVANIVLRSDTVGIADYAFFDCYSLTSVTIGNSVTSIGHRAFYGCSRLASVTIPDSVTSIGDWAFYYCSSLTSVTIGNSVTSIGDSAFYGCSSLTSVVFENTSGWKAGSTSLGSRSLANTSTAATYLRSTYCGYTWTRS